LAAGAPLRRLRLGDRRVDVVWLATLVAVCLILASAGWWAQQTATDQLEPEASPQAVPPFPLDEQLSYKVSWMGIHCGAMTLESFGEPGEDDPMYRIVMTARTSSFFDGVYRVRSRIDSWYSGSRQSTVRYQQHSEEKKRVNEHLYVVDFDAGEVLRTKNGVLTTIPFETDQLNDPLVYLYRMRELATGPGDQLSLTMMTDRGDLETIAEVVEKKKISTPFGKREALKVVPQPKDEMLFAKKGKMALWIGTDGARVLYRVEFDLAFGKLTARLVEIKERDPDTKPQPTQ